MIDQWLLWEVSMAIKGAIRSTDDETVMHLDSGGGHVHLHLQIKLHRTKHT